MDQTLLELNELKLVRSSSLRTQSCTTKSHQSHQDTDQALDGQIDGLLLDNIRKINDIIGK